MVTIPYFIFHVTRKCWLKLIQEYITNVVFFDIKLILNMKREEQTFFFTATIEWLQRIENWKVWKKLNMCKWLIVEYILVVVFIFLDHGCAKKIICDAVLFKKIILCSSFYFLCTKDETILIYQTFLTKRVLKLNQCCMPKYFIFCFFLFLQVSLFLSTIVWRCQPSGTSMN